MKLTFKNTKINSLKIIIRDRFENNVGSFERLFCEDQFKNFGLNKKIVQENKIISCIKGKVFDVAIDIRKNSDTFLKWHGEVLSEDNQTSIFIPEGFAHGFQALTDDCEMVYFHSAYYNFPSERGILYNDKRINIDWPLEIKNLSEKDINLLPVTKDFKGIKI